MANTFIRSVDIKENASGYHPETVKFANADEAWFWAMGCLLARQQGARFSANKGLTRRPCEPDDVINCLDTLYRQRQIDLHHARVLRIWGERRQPPDPTYASEAPDHRIWREAMQRMRRPLHVKGIIA
jgi:hypothetical protein